MRMTKRERIKNKYNGLCAYTGKELGDDWQIDHAVSVMRSKMWLHGRDFDHNSEDNLSPVLKIVNHYKRSFDLDGFRKYMLSFHERLSRVPKNPRSSKGIKYKEYMWKVADAFGITPEKPFSGVFYFETLTAATGDKLSQMGE